MNVKLIFIIAVLRDSVVESTTWVNAYMIWALHPFLASASIRWLHSIHLGLRSASVCSSCHMHIDFTPGFTFRLRVTRATANQGREFFTCPNSRPPSDDGMAPTGCNFFQWADGRSQTWQPSLASPGFPNNSSRGRISSTRDGSSSVGVSLGHVPMWPPPASTGLQSMCPLPTACSLLFAFFWNV